MRFCSISARGRANAEAPAGAALFRGELRASHLRGLRRGPLAFGRPSSRGLRELYPDVRVELHADGGTKLSDELQDGQSYRYGIVNLGGRDRAQVLERFETCRELLGISLLPADTFITTLFRDGSETSRRNVP